MALLEAGGAKENVFLNFEIVKVDDDGVLFISRKPPQTMSSLNFRWEQIYIEVS